MSNDIYPSNLPGLSIDVEKEMEFDTLVQRAVGGKELRIGQRLYPLWNFRLSYNFLRDNTAFPELVVLGSFFLKRQGMADSFLFADPDDSTTSLQSFGVGTGAQTIFQLTRSWGGFAEPVLNVASMPDIFVNGIICNMLVNAGFETSPISTAWTPTVSASDHVITRVSSPVVSNAWSARAVNPTAGQASYQYQVVSVAPSTTYTASAYVYVSSITAGAQDNRSLLVLDTENSNAVYQETTLTSGHTLNTWVQKVLTFTTGPTTTQIEFRLYSPQGTVYWDGAGLWHLPTVPSDYTDLHASVGATGVVTFSRAPTSGHSLTWSGRFYHRCRFLSDKLTLTKFLHQIWKTGKVSFVGSLQDKI